MNKETKNAIFEEVYEIYADFEDLCDEDLIKCRDTISQRLETLLELLK
jgi:hypothetical protein